MPTDSHSTLPDPYPITPVGDGHKHFSCIVPGSKSITNRALPLAVLAPHPFTLTGVLFSEDTEVMLDCLTKLGFELEVDHAQHTVRTKPKSNTNRIPVSHADLYVANSGTTVRFLGAMLGLGHGTYKLDGVPRMRERPIQDLLDGLNQLGIDAKSDHATGCPPITITSQGWRGGHVRVKADVSSQYLSGLLLAAPFGTEDTNIEIIGEVVSEPYIDMTIAMLKDFGLSVERRGSMYFIPGNQQVTSTSYAIEPDASSASYFYAYAAILGVSVTVRGLHFDSLQGDVQFVRNLEAMGCQVQEESDGICVQGTGKLRGIGTDMNAISDTVMTLAAVACFADGPTMITNVAHIRHKETDRLSAIATELRKTGIVIEEREDGLTIHPGPMHAATFDTYNDHRMAMSLALLGLRIPGIKINNPSCTAKTYPNFWADLEALR